MGGECADELRFSKGMFQKRNRGHIIKPECPRLAKPCKNYVLEAKASNL